jgi:photosystem II stability/assembly factor-like uncharacterized protein
MKKKMPKASKKKKIKDVRKLIGRNNMDHILSGAGIKTGDLLKVSKDINKNPANKRMLALEYKRKMKNRNPTAPISGSGPNWVPVGPAAVPLGQTYGGSRVNISGRVTVIVPHPTDSNTIYLGGARGGVWKTTDGGQTWVTNTDNCDSLAIGALGISKSNPQVLYAGTGEGNLQYYSTEIPLESSQGVFMGHGVLKSANGGGTWATQGSALFSNHAFYRISVDPNNANNAFAASSAGLCRTTDGSTWNALSGAGLPALSATIVACTDVIFDIDDATGNTIYAAFWSSGVYKSTNALSASPTWTAVTGIPTGLPNGRITLSQSASMPQKIYALLNIDSITPSFVDGFGAVYLTTDATGLIWSEVPLPAGISAYGAYTCNIVVDQTTPNTFYVSGVSLYKCVLSGATWSVTDIGEAIHPDNHAFAIDPNNNLNIYAGTDGGFYTSPNAGTSWDDSKNKGLPLLQFEVIDHHPTSDVVVIGGTQDNGTEQFRNSPVFYHSADGDGGYCNISPVTPAHVVHSYYEPSFERSTLAGDFSSWTNVSPPVGGGLFYVPAALSPTSERMVVGTATISIDDTQGTGGWPTNVSLPGLSAGAEDVSGISFASDTIIYAATTLGKVYRLDKSGSSWTVRTLHTAPLPTNAWIWDIQAVPGNVNSVVVVFSGFGINHVWQGTVPVSGTATWASISGSGASAVPDVPAYAIAFLSATEFYVGNDIGVFSTSDGGATWQNFSQGLPNTAIYDLKFHTPTSLLRAGTNGRGLWQIMVTAGYSASDLYFRDNSMQSGLFNSSGYVTAAFNDPLNLVSLGDTLAWWECTDIKVDSPSPTYQVTPPIDYYQYETAVTHRDAIRGSVNHVYVEVHNRGPLPASNVTVCVMYGDASMGLQPLPTDYWTNFPNSAGNSYWTLLGSATIPTVNPLIPEVLNFNFKPTATQATHTCIFAVMTSPDNPIPAASQIFDVNSLVTAEKRAGLHNLHLVNAAAPFIPIPFWAWGLKRQKYLIEIIKPETPVELDIHLIMPTKLVDAISRSKKTKIKTKKLANGLKKNLKEYFEKTEYRSIDYSDNLLMGLDFSRGFNLSPKIKRLEFPALSFQEKTKFMLVVNNKAKLTKPVRITIAQKTVDGKIIGGSTFVVEASK